MKIFAYLAIKFNEATCLLGHQLEKDSWITNQSMRSIFKYSKKFTSDSLLQFKCNSVSHFKRSGPPGKWSTLIGTHAVSRSSRAPVSSCVSFPAFVFPPLSPLQERIVDCSD